MYNVSDMKYYLSSYKLGNEADKLKAFIQQTSGTIGYVPNALDFSRADPKRRKTHITGDMDAIRALGADVEELDLRNYFGKADELRTKLQRLGGLFVSGGNVFVLRQAMKLSGLDNLLPEIKDRNNFVYAGYSAGVCVLSPTLRTYAQVDDATDLPYPQQREQIWEGLGMLDFVFEPHYDSPDHPETQKINDEINYCIENKILFKAYRDGEVLIME